MRSVGRRIDEGAAAYIVSACQRGILAPESLETRSDRTSLEVCILMLRYEYSRRL